MTPEERIALGEALSALATAIAKVHLHTLSLATEGSPLDERMQAMDDATVSVNKAFDALGAFYKAGLGDG